MQTVAEISRLLERAERSLVQVIAYEGRDKHQVEELRRQTDRIAQNVDRIARNMEVINGR